MIVTAANAHDVTQLEALIDAIPPLKGRSGRPRHRPRLVQADCAYQSGPAQRHLRNKGIRTLIARRGREHGSGLGKTRWVVERTFAWLRQFRRLRVRYERKASIHEAFLHLGCSLICFRFLQRSFC